MKRTISNGDKIVLSPGQGISTSGITTLAAEINYIPVNINIPEGQIACFSLDKNMHVTYEIGISGVITDLTGQYLQQQIHNGSGLAGDTINIVTDYLG